MNIDFSRLSRNYEMNPLTSHEQICEEDLRYLYIECNLTYEQIAPIFNRKGVAIRRRCKKLGLIKSKEQQKLSIENVYMEKYGVKNPAQLQSSKDKAKKTCLQKYGTDNYTKTEEYKIKTKKTCLDKYGVDNPAKAQEIKDKTKQNNLDKYGVEHPMMLEKTKHKHQITLLENYGVEVPLKNDKIKQKQANTCLKRYGTKNPMTNEELRNKQKQVIQQKYGVDNIMQVFKESNLNEAACEVKKSIKDNFPEMTKKITETKRRNNSFNISSIEKRIEELLNQKFKVLIQYKSEKYPFNCDFYIPILDLYIEYQGTWTHGKFPFEDNQKCIEKLEKWKLKAETSDFYKNAINTWTKRDVLKRNTAKQNNLNWIEFFSFNEFMEWYETI